MHEKSIKVRIAQLFFYTMVVVLFAWTGSLTVSFVSSALPGSFWLLPILALVIFDGGMVAWMIVFLSYAQGSLQRAISLTLCLVNLVGVGLMVTSEILFSGQQLTAAPEIVGTAAIWGIGLWTFINVAGVIAFHLGDPQARKAMAIQDQKDSILEGALQDLKMRRIEHQEALSQELGASIYRELLAELRVGENGRSGSNGGPPALPLRRTAVPISELTVSVPRGSNRRTRSKKYVAKRPDTTGQ